MIYGSETWALTSLQGQKLKRAEAQMIRWMSGATLRDRIPTSAILTSLGIDSITEVVTRARLRWFGHIHRKSEDDWVRKVTNMTVVGSRPPGRPQKSWQELVATDLRRLRLRPTDADDRQRWRQAIHEPTSSLGPPRRQTLNRR